MRAAVPTPRPSDRTSRPAAPVRRQPVPEAHARGTHNLLHDQPAVHAEAPGQRTAVVGPPDGPLEREVDRGASEGPHSPEPMRTPLHRPPPRRHTPESAPEPAPPAARRGLLHAAPAASLGALRVSRPSDGREHEADRLADHALGSPVPVRFGTVRLHTGPGAAALTQALHAEALAVGDHVAFAPGALAPHTPRGRRLLAHEVAHVAQGRRDGAPALARRLVAGGDPADVRGLLDLVEANTGLLLVWDPATGEVSAVGSTGNPHASVRLEALLLRIIDDPGQDAEITVGQNQARVAVGAFPQPQDFTGPRAQRIDLDDVLALEAGAPGHGVAKLAHEITENYVAHASAPAAGVSLFGPSHRAAMEAESDVTEETVGPGRRVASGTAATGSGLSLVVQDFETYYLVYERTLDTTDLAASNFEITDARQTARVAVGTFTIDAFATGSDALPATAAAQVAAAAAALAPHTHATVRIEGFTDSVGAEADNEALGRDRAEAVRAALVAAGVAARRIHGVGVGEGRPAASNATAAGRARNRRVVVQIDRPDYP